jgi:DNA-binding FadR family transcriptional regulator
LAARRVIVRQGLGQRIKIVDRIIAQTQEPEEARPASSSGLLDQVVNYLRERVASEGLRPGAKLPSETSISATLGISRPIVREAMRSLASTGLIQMAVGKRAEVVPVDGEMICRVIENALLIGQADTRDVLEMRRSLEIGMVALAAERRTEAQVVELKRISAEMAKCLKSGKAYSALDLRFHLALAEATGNPLYTLLIEAFRQTFEASMLVGIERWSATPELSRVQELHEAIVETVAAGDPEAAAAAMRQHFDDALQAIVTPSEQPGREPLRRKAG